MVDVENSDEVVPYAPFPSFSEFQPPTFEANTFDSIALALRDVRETRDATELAETLRQATKWAAVNTGAIEGLYEVDRGFTYTVAESAAAWNQMYRQVGREAQQTIEDALESYDYVLDFTTGKRPLTEAWIRELHAVACKSQETYTVHTAQGPQEQGLPKGKYKKYPNNPFNLRSQSIHAYAPVEDVPAEMARLVSEIKQDDFQSSHSLIQAAYIHYTLVCVHPFADGNGRVARALASIFLYRDPGVPLVIFADQKAQYLDALELADDGNYRAIIEFISDRTIDAVRIVMESIRTSRNASFDESLTDLQQSLRGRSGLLHEEVDALGRRLADEWVRALNDEISRLDIQLPLSVEVRADNVHHNSPPVNTYRAIPQSRHVSVTFRSSGPGEATVHRGYSVFAGKGLAPVPDFMIFTESNEVVDAEIRELDPQINPALSYRLTLRAQAEIRDLLVNVVALAKESLRGNGYADFK